MKYLALPALIAAFLLNSSAFAATTVANIDAAAGLQPAMTLSCSPIDFGVWRVKLGETVTIQLDPHSGQAGVLQGASTVRSSTSSYSLGGCSLSGSNEPDGTMVNISASAGSPIVGDGSVYSGLTAGGAPSTVNISLDIPFAQVYGGSANFTIGGSVDFGLITRQSMGAYKTGVPFTLTAQ